MPTPNYIMAPRNFSENQEENSATYGVRSSVLQDRHHINMLRARVHDLDLKDDARLEKIKVKAREWGNRYSFPASSEYIADTYDREKR